ncbi:hypothetical protein [Escherichia phage AV110]|uniref:Uncharacterized protein n=1 Tax=Escherichia phage moskry TaxID=2696425 RepID=A0A6B9XBV9_9CAUD|nr:hypothetical protein moskry_225 [Escherichia phage moskry]WPK33878.1 hypothetical protein [Escherichia phage AV110]
MKAYLETVVVANKDGGDVSTSCSQIILDFPNNDSYNIFMDNFDTYEKGPNFEVYRTLLPIVD